MQFASLKLQHRLLNCTFLNLIFEDYYAITVKALGNQPRIETKRNAENNIIKIIWIKFVGFKTKIREKYFINIILGSSKKCVYL